MVKSETEVILEELKSIRSNLEEINKRLSHTRLKREVAPRAVSVQEAAVLLSQGLTKTREMVKLGALATVDVGRRRMVPMSEIERITEVPEVRVRARPTGRKARHAATSAAEMRDWLKKQHKKR